MKNLIYILALFTLPVFGTNYYVKNGGSDIAAGTSDGAAWATTTKVAGFALQPGDSVFFNRGDLWRCTTHFYLVAGTSDARVYYGYYGTGAKPLFLGSKEENSTDDWVDQGDSIWRNSDALFSTEVGNIIYNNNSVSKRELTQGNVNAQGEFYWSATGYIDVYSTSNPATYYTDIECAMKNTSGIVYMSSRDYITIDGFDVRYGASIGIAATNGASNITIKNCDVAFIGGALSYSTTRLGNGIQFWRDATNILIENNRVSNCLDAGITSQSAGTNSTITVSNFRIQNNIVIGCDMGIEWWYTETTGGTVTGVYIEHNTFHNSGRGLFHAQKTSNIRGSAMYISTIANVTPTNCYVRNNIFSNALLYEIDYTSLWTLNSITKDYNIFNVGDVAVKYAGTEYATLANWVTYSGDDANSISGDPDFVNASADSFQLVLGSPAIGAGLGVGVSYDYDGNYRADPPSIGAYEYDATEPEPPPPVLPNLSAVSIFDLTINSVRFYASVTDDGEATVTVRGFCYATTINPTTAGAKTENGTGEGAFEANVSGLNNGTKYYVRAYATNSVWTAYSANISFTTYSTDSQSFTSGGKRVIHTNKRVIK